MIFNNNKWKNNNYHNGLLMNFNNTNAPLLIVINVSLIIHRIKNYDGCLFKGRSLFKLKNWCSQTHTKEFYDFWIK